MSQIDERKIEELLTRSIAVIYPTAAALAERLRTGRPLRVYTGIDPTGTYVHLGHATNYLVLRRFHELGHKIIVLIGDFTAMIGDPSDKTAARQRLTPEQVQANLKTFKQQIGKILDFDHPDNPVEFRFNSEWLAKLSFPEIVELASHFTVQRMLERDIFVRRLQEQKPLYVHEFFYPLMQGYDSVALQADVEVGGTDQTFNMLAGRQLVKDYQQREKVVVTTTLLENPATGEKLMSKSLGTGIALDAGADQMFGQVMALADAAMIQCFVDCTTLPLEDIKTLEQQLNSGANPRDLKLRLAREIVTLYHDATTATAAEAAFIKTFSQQAIPDDLTPVAAVAGELLATALVRVGIVKSKSEFRRLLNEGALHDLDAGQPLTNAEATVVSGLRLKIGKRRFVKIILS